jgi:putative phage repressor|nr:MAG TPA: helix-turn-helix domain protein [Caudoviricetes sp.]
MTLGDVIKSYRAEHSLSMDEFAKRCGLSKGYISMLEKNRNPKTGKPIIPSILTYQSVANAMSTSVDILMRTVDKEQLVSLEQSPSPASDELPAITRRDERQIAKDLEDMLHSLKGSAAMGELEDEEDMELLKASLRQAMTLSKRIAKKKFTPKKYRK